jgi:hypothetical protein
MKTYWCCKKNTTRVDKGSKKLIRLPFPVSGEQRVLILNLILTDQKSVITDVNDNLKVCKYKSPV